jgi:hypothetical protein
MRYARGAPFCVNLCKKLYHNGKGVKRQKDKRLGEVRTPVPKPCVKDYTTELQSLFLGSRCFASI